MFFYSMKVKFAGLGFTIFSCKIFKNEKKESNLFRLMKIHEKNYIHHDLHSGNILSHDRPHNHLLIFSILKVVKIQVTKSYKLQGYQSYSLLNSESLSFYTKLQILILQ